MLSQPPFYYNRSFWNVIIVAITLWVLIWYTLETNTIAKWTKWWNLRPVILRVWFIEKWREGIVFECNEENHIDWIPLNYMISKNIATNINWYIVINWLKHELLFWNSISTRSDSKISYSNIWGRMNYGDSYIRVVFKNDSKTTIKTLDSNKIVINYSDIEWNKYHTIEDENFKQKSLRWRL